MFYLSRYVNVIHVTINIPFNDKSMPEKELLLQYSDQAAALYQSPSYSNISTLHITNITWYFQERWSQPDPVAADSVGEEQADSSPPCKSFTQLIEQNKNSM